jgi:GNAT superfamily N-acetyltransferase
VRVRRARPADARRLTALAHAAKRHWGDPERWIRLWARDLTLDPEQIARGDVFCAVRGSRVLGFYSLSGSGRERELEHLFVSPAQIGRGVGRRLFAHLARRLRARGVRRLRIASDPHAQGFYLRLGARRVGEVLSTPAPRRLPLLRYSIAAPR